MPVVAGTDAIRIEVFPVIEPCREVSIGSNIAAAKDRDTATASPTNAKQKKKQNRRACSVGEQISQAPPHQVAARILLKTFTTH